MQKTYAELCPGERLTHLATTIEQYLSEETPLWWVEPVGEPMTCAEALPTAHNLVFPTAHEKSRSQPIACLWLGNAIDQINGHRHTHIFLLYIVPSQRRQGIGTALMRYAEDWAAAKGETQIGLQVFVSNQLAFNLYQRLGYQTQSFWMVKPLAERLDKS